MVDLPIVKGGRTAIEFGVVLIGLLISACVSIDADFFISIDSLKVAWRSEDKILLPAELLVPSSAKAKNCQESIDQLNPVLHKYFNNPEVNYCAKLTRRTVIDENGNKTQEFTLNKNEFLTGYHTSSGSEEVSYGVMAVRAAMRVTRKMPSEEFISFSAEASDDAVIIRMYVNKELHQNLANEVQEFSNVRLSTKDGNALIPHLGRFNIEIDNDSAAECRVEFEGRTSVLKPSEKKQFRLDYTLDEVYSSEGFQALAIGGCLL